MKWNLRGYVLAAWGCSLAVGAEAPPTMFLGPAQPSSPPITSSSQRFVFRGFQAGDGTRFAVWTEEVAGRLERMLGEPIPFRRYEMVRFNGVGEEPADRGRIVMTQGYVETLLQQRIMVLNPDQVEEEELVEALVRVLLNRYLLGIADREGVGNQGMSLPDWLSVGIAQNMTARLRSRNLQFLREQGENAVGWEAADILTWLELPAGRTAEKSACGLFVGWLDERIARTMRWGGVMRRLVAGKDLTMDWLARDALGLEDPAQAEAAWRDWRVRRIRGAVEPMQLDLAAVAELKRALEIRPGAFGVPADEDVPVLLTPAMLLSYRERPWAQTIARSLHAEFRRRQATAPPELAAVYGAYVEVLDGLPRVPERGLFWTRRGSGVPTRQLEETLAEADSRLAALEKNVAMRTSLLQQAGAADSAPAEWPPASDGPDAAAPDGFPAPEEETLREERTDYLDRIETLRRAGAGEEAEDDRP